MKADQKYNLEGIRQEFLYRIIGDGSRDHFPIPHSWRIAVPDAGEDARAPRIAYKSTNLYPFHQIIR